MRVEHRGDVSMEFFDSYRLDRARAKLSEALSRLQGSRTESRLSPETLKLARGVALLMTSCVFAWISVISTSEMSIVDYRASHHPPPSLWRAILRSRGYRMIETSKEREKLMRAPEAFSRDRQSAQISPGHETVIFPRGSLAEATELWHREEPSIQTKGWTTITINLNGLEDLDQILEKNPPRPQARFSGAPKFIDPKEIRY
jgi:hypothetical protein